jgi:hypothetical protein
MNAFEIRWDILQHASHALRERWHTQNEMSRDNAHQTDPSQVTNRANCNQYKLADFPAFDEIKELADKMYDFVQGQKSE